jgi:hypothetical protein
MPPAKEGIDDLCLSAIIGYSLGDLSRTQARLKPDAQVIARMIHPTTQFATSNNPVLRDPANPDAAKFVNGINGNEYLPGKEVFPIPFGTMMTSFANDFTLAHQGPTDAFFLQNLQAIANDWEGGLCRNRGTNSQPWASAGNPWRSTEWQTDSQQTTRDHNSHGIHGVTGKAETGVNRFGNSEAH